MLVVDALEAQWSIYKFRSMSPGTHQAINLWVPNLFSESNTNIGESSAGIDSFIIESGIWNNDAKEKFSDQAIVITFV